MTTYLTERITVDPERCSGRPTIRGTRLPVHTVLDCLAAGDTPADILTGYSMLEAADITACLQFAANLMEHYPDHIAA